MTTRKRKAPACALVRAETTALADNASLPKSERPRRLSEAGRELVRWLVREELKKWAAA